MIMNNSTKTVDDIGSESHNKLQKIVDHNDEMDDININGFGRVVDDDDNGNIEMNDINKNGQINSDYIGS